jgi:hypothetical protein
MVCRMGGTGYGDSFLDIISTFTRAGKTFAGLLGLNSELAEKGHTLKAISPLFSG